MAVPQLRVASKYINLGFLCSHLIEVRRDMEQESAALALISAFLSFYLPVHSSSAKLWVGPVVVLDSDLDDWQGALASHTCLIPESQEHGGSAYCRK